MNSLRSAVDATVLAMVRGLIVALLVSTLDGAFMLPLGISAVTVGFGFRSRSTGPCWTCGPQRC